MKKQLLGVMIGLSLLAPAAKAVDLASINFADVQSKLVQVKDVAQNEIKPVVEQIVSFINNGQFEELRSFAKANAGKIASALSAATSATIDNLPAIASALQNYLNNNTAFLEQVPAEYKSTVATVKSNIANNVSRIDELKAQLVNIQPLITKANIEKGIDALVGALKDAANSREYNDIIKPAVNTYYKDKLQPVINKLATARFERIQTGGTELINLVRGQDWSLPKVAQGVGEIRNVILPYVVALVATLPEFIITLNNSILDANVVRSWPTVSQQAFNNLQSALGVLQSNAAAVNDTLHTANTKISELLGKVAEPKPTVVAVPAKTFINVDTKKQ